MSHVMEKKTFPQNSCRGKKGLGALLRSIMSQIKPEGLGKIDSKDGKQTSNLT